MIDMQWTGGRIANARREKGFTQEELAERLGVTAQAVSKWERGLSLPDVDMTCAVAKMLDVSLDSLLDAEAAPSVRAMNVYDMPSEFWNKVQEVPVQVEFGLTAAIAIAVELEKGGYERIGRLREEIYRDTGVLLPMIRIKDDAARNLPNQCRIRFWGKTVWEKSFDASEELYAATLNALERELRGRLAIFVNRHMVKLLVERLRNTYPFAVEGVVPERVGLTYVKLVCRVLVESGVSIRNFLTVVETLDDLREQDIADIDAAVRCARDALTGK